MQDLNESERILKQIATLLKVSCSARGGFRARGRLCNLQSLRPMRLVPVPPSRAWTHVFACYTRDLLVATRVSETIRARNAAHAGPTIALHGHTPACHTHMQMQSSPEKAEMQLRQLQKTLKDQQDQTKLYLDKLASAPPTTKPASFTMDDGMALESFGRVCVSVASRYGLAACLQRPLVRGFVDGGECTRQRFGVFAHFCKRIS